MPITINGSGSILGVSTLTQLSTLDVGGNVSVGGTLTYEDVSNIDAVGVVTARSGIHVTGGNVGIGTDNPDTSLHIHRDDVSSFDAIWMSGSTKRKNVIKVNNSDNLIIGIDENNEGNDSNFRLEIDGSEKLRVTSDGYVGINETNPIHQLSVGLNTSTAWDSTKNISNTTNNDFIGLNIDNKNSGANPEVGIMLQAGASGSGQYTINCLRTGSNTADLIFRTRDGGAASKEQLRIGSAGQIGLSGANYGTAGQVIKSGGANAAPTWSNLYSYYFYGEQDSQQTWPHATYKKLQNLGNYAVNVGSSSIATWSESSGALTIGDDGAGHWFLSMGGGIDDIQSADYVQVVIGKNGGTTSVGTRVSSYSRAYSSAGNQITNATVSCIANLSVGDVVRFYLYHNEGTTDEHSEPSRCFVMGYKI